MKVNGITLLDYNRVGKSFSKVFGIIFLGFFALENLHAQTESGNPPGKIESPASEPPKPTPTEEKKNPAGKENDKQQETTKQTGEGKTSPDPEKNNDAQASLKTDIPVPVPFTRYKILVDKSPFAPATVVPTPTPEAPSFVSTLFITGILQKGPNHMVFITTRDAVPKRFALKTGEKNEDGIELVGVENSKQQGKSKVMLKKGTEFGTVTYDEMAIRKQAPPPATPPVPGQPGQPGQPRQPGTASNSRKALLPKPSPSPTVIRRPTPTQRSRTMPIRRSRIITP